MTNPNWRDPFQPPPWPQQQQQQQQQHHEHQRQEMRRQQRDQHEQQVRQMERMHERQRQSQEQQMRQMHQQQRQQRQDEQFREQQRRWQEEQTQRVREMQEQQHRAMENQFRRWHEAEERRLLDRLSDMHQKEQTETIGSESGGETPSPHGSSPGANDGGLQPPSAFMLEPELRQYLRDSRNVLSKDDPVSRHQEAMTQMWKEALGRARGDIAMALAVLSEATKSRQQHMESRREYKERLRGIPSKAFGDQHPNAGEDKPQHFWGSANNAYRLAKDLLPEPIPKYYAGFLVKVAGRAWETWDWARSLVKNTGGYDLGDIYADDFGAAFGAALAESSTNGLVDISEFLPKQATP